MTGSSQTRSTHPFPKEGQPNTTLSALRDHATTLMSHLESPRLDAEVLLSHVLKKPRSYLHTWPDADAPEEISQPYLRLVEHRAAGEPIAYLTGNREFWSMELSVTSDTLIPRPETETLVELALQRIPKSEPWKIADLGTGSGAIALAVSKERPLCNIVATDLSPSALRVAAFNAHRVGATQVCFLVSDWCQSLGNQIFHVIISNPPYIKESDPHLSGVGVRFEPRCALASGPDGLDAIRQLIPQALTRLRPDGYLLLEHGYQQGSMVCDLLSSHGFYNIHDFPDDAGRSRVSVGQAPPA